MGNRLLATVIEWEKALQEEICRETERAVAWREREIAVAAEGLCAARQQMLDTEAAALAQARQKAEADGLRLLAAAEAHCSRLETLPDAFLEEILRRQLKILLPEGDDDHPHGQG